MSRLDGGYRDCRISALGRNLSFTEAWQLLKNAEERPVTVGRHVCIVPYGIGFALHLRIAPAPALAQPHQLHAPRRFSFRILRSVDASIASPKIFHACLQAVLNKCGRPQERAPAPARSPIKKAGDLHRRPKYLNESSGRRSAFREMEGETRPLKLKSMTA